MPPLTESIPTLYNAINENTKETVESGKKTDSLKEEILKLRTALETRNDLDKEERARSERREIRYMKMFWGLFVLNALLAGANVTKMLGWW